MSKLDAFAPPQERHSFFNTFEYAHVEDDAFDGGFAYYDVEVLKDIITGTGLKLLCKGERFQQVNWNLGAGTFSFIDWYPASTVRTSVKPKRIEIAMQSELAPYLVW
jgi:hypothetical protein